MKLFRFFSFLMIVAMIFSLGYKPTTAQAQQTENTQAAIDKLQADLMKKFAEEGSADFIVRFTNQADLSPAYSMSWEKRGTYVYDALTAATLDQANAKSYLDGRSLKHTTFIAGNELYVFSGVQTDALALAALPEVDSIRSIRTYFTDPHSPVELNSYNVPLSQPNGLAWGISYTKADQFWIAYGVQGDGIKVASLDSGVQWDHPALDQAFACPGDPTNAACWSDPLNVCGATGACDHDGHGTHTTGTMVADDDPTLTWQAGMAPGATWIACKAFEGGSANDYEINVCADWMLAPGGSTANRPNIVNNSWGSTPDGSTWFETKITAWRAAGIFPAFSAGNSGPACGSLGDPGSYASTFASGMINSAGIIDAGSSRGPSAFGTFTKPNIAAPGVSVCSSVPGSGWNCGYSGTSMASPHSAGAVALLWSCNPDLIGQIDQTIAVLEDTAVDAPAGACGTSPDGGDYAYGYGYLDVLAAGQSACGAVDFGHIDGHVYESDGVTPIEGATVTAAPGSLAGASIDATTDPTGYYTMTLVVSTYNVTASALGFAPQTANGVVVQANLTTTQDFSLGVLGGWTAGPAACFDLTRIDAEFYPANGLIYILGGRTGADTDGNIYSYNPTTGACADTGEDMPFPISNYTINLVNDGTADVLCTLGGRGAAGTAILNVQCYNPMTNVATSVGNLPAAYTGYTPGGQAVVDNKVYVFGGFNNAASPYELSRTDRWDPVANTFTQIGNLSLARAYLQVAVVDGAIYAFGGTVFDGTNLTAQTRTEVMADPGGAGTWDDAAVAELPTASGEARAFGFDSDSPYSLANQIVITGGGLWPAETPEVLVYDIATDTYDYSFTDLLVSRRDHGGAFVPLNSADPLDGLPGMWVFGGRSSAAGYGGDNPPYAPVEFYPLTVLAAAPDIEVTPLSLSATLLTDQTDTQQLEICNVGDADLIWNVSELAGTQKSVGQDVVVSVPAIKANAEAASRSGNRSFPAREFTMHLDRTSLDIIDVLLVTPDVVGAGDISLLEATLAAMPDVNPTLWDGAAGTPTMADMLLYDVVFVGNDILWTSSAIDKLTLSENLADYIDAGGKVLISSFIWSYDQWGMEGGRFLTEDYSPFEIATADFWDPITLGDFDETHPIMQGVTTYMENYNHQDPVLSSTGVWVASWADGENFVAVSPNVVGLNALYFSAADFGGDAGVLLHNALMYLSPSVDVPWLSETPTSGTVAPGACVTVDVTFDSTGLALGQYLAALEISSNDPNDPAVNVPVTLNVVEDPDIAVTPTSIEQTLEAGTSWQGTVTINNNGVADLIISDITSSETWLTFIGLPTFPSTILPGEFDTFMVNIDTTGLAAGDYTADITITSNDPDTPVLTVTVTLHVTEPPVFLLFLPIIMKQ